MKTFVVQLECFVESEETPKMATFKLIIPAVSYTDAEASAFKYYEKNLMGQSLKSPKVKKITEDTSDQYIDLTPIQAPEEETDLMDFCKVFKAKVALAFSENIGKKIARSIVARGIDMESVMSDIQQKCLDMYDAASADVIDIKETDLYHKSPVFDLEDE